MKFEDRNCGNCIYFNGDEEETQEQFCDER